MSYIQKVIYTFKRRNKNKKDEPLQLCKYLLINNGNSYDNAIEKSLRETHRKMANLSNADLNKNRRYYFEKES